LLFAEQIAHCSIDPIILRSLSLGCCIDLPSSTVLYKRAASHSAPHIVTEGAEAPSKGSLITASTATACTLVRTHTTIGYDGVQLLSDAVESGVSNCRIHADGVLGTESRDLSSLISNLLVAQGIELRLDSSRLVVDLVLQSHEGRVDLVMVGIRPLLDIVKACSGLS